MKKWMLLSLTLLSLAAGAQEHAKEKVQAAPGVVYGKLEAGEATPVPVDALKTKLVNNAYQGQVQGRVAEVCKAEGCWIKLQRADGSRMMVRARDHGFLMPENIVGKTVIIEGSAVVKETTEEMRRHYAEDAGKSKKEIAKIKGSEKDIQFAATGVKVVD